MPKTGLCYSDHIHPFFLKCTHECEKVLTWTCTNTVALGFQSRTSDCLTMLNPEVGWC